MSVQDDDTTPKPKPKRAARTRRAGHGKARPKPPTTVTPGWIHDALAAFTLRMLEDQGADAGDIGDEFLRRIPGAEDSPEPAVLLSRVYAHLAYRIPVMRSVAKRFEGREARAGLASDLLALVLQLWVRNRDLVQDFAISQAARAATEVKAERTVRERARDEPLKTSPWADIISRRFGVKVASPDAPTGTPDTSGPPHAAEEGAT